MIWLRTLFFALTFVGAALVYVPRWILGPEGRALVVLSSDGDGRKLLAALRAAGFAVEAVAQKDLINELLTVYAVRHDHPA